jgi:hypothetical protein
MKGEYGSFMAILKDGRHYTNTGYFTSFAEFKEFVKACLKLVRNDVAKFYYAYGHEAQEYTPSEFREVFFGE